MLLGRERRLATLDFGLSDVQQPGLIRYKRKFATEERNICSFEWRPERYRHACADHASEMLHRIVGLLTDPSVPDEITQKGGEELYRFFA